MALTEEQREIALRVAEEVWPSKSIIGLIPYLERFLAALPKPEVVAWGNFKADGSACLLSISQHPEDRARWLNPRPLYAEAPIAQPASAPSEQNPVGEVIGRNFGCMPRVEWYDSFPEAGTLIYTAPQPDYKTQRDAERYRWLRDHNKSWSWNPSQYNKEIISGFAAFNTGYLGFEFESALDSAIASVKGGA